MTTNPMHKGLIALVEDDFDVRETLAEVLVEEGYQVMGFGSGPEALKALAEAKELPGLLLLDLRMPKMDGFAFRALQQQDTRLFAIPTVILSADTNVEENRLQLQAQGYLRKPVHIQALVDLVERFFVNGETVSKA